MLPKDITTTAASPAADDYVHLNGAINKSRKFLLKLMAMLESPTFTGVPKAPTPSGTEPKALVTVDFDMTTVSTATKNATLEALYPVGEILITYRSGNPNSWLGFGTWVAFGAGKTLIGLDAGGDADFDTLGDTGGAKTHTISANNLPTHTHSIPSLTGTTSSDGAHTHTLDRPRLGADSDRGGNSSNFSIDNTETATTSSSGAHTHTVTTTASNTGNNTTTATAVNHMNPFITVAMWRRSA